MTEETCPNCQSHDVGLDQCEICDGHGNVDFDEDENPIDCWRCKGECVIHERNYCVDCEHVWYKQVI